jgi:predicted DsbA family dithiol-disulfide isomerase
MQAHLVLKAVELIGGPTQHEAMALMVRQAFFQRGEDISDLDLLLNKTTALAAICHRYMEFSARDCAV